MSTKKSEQSKIPANIPSPDQLNDDALAYINNLPIDILSNAIEGENRAPSPQESQKCDHSTPKKPKLDETVAKMRPSPEIYAKLAKRGVVKKQAAIIAGYSPTTNTAQIEALHPDVCGDIETQRAKLAAKAGLTLMDQAKVYKRIRDNGESDDTCLRAATRLDKILGYEAPSQVQVSDRSGLTAAIITINNYASDLQLSPAAMLDRLDVTDISEIDN